MARGKESSGTGLLCNCVIRMVITFYLRWTNNPTQPRLRLRRRLGGGLGGNIITPSRFVLRKAGYKLQPGGSLGSHTLAPYGCTGNTKHFASPVLNQNFTHAYARIWLKTERIVRPCVKLLLWERERHVPSVVKFKTENLCGNTVLQNNVYISDLKWKKWLTGLLSSFSSVFFFKCENLGRWV